MRDKLRERGNAFAALGIVHQLPGVGYLLAASISACARIWHPGAVRSLIRLRSSSASTPIIYHMARHIPHGRITPYPYKCKPQSNRAPVRS